MVMTMRQASPNISSSLQGKRDTVITANDLHWKKVRCEKDSLNNILYMQTAYIPRSLSKVAISILQETGETYVTGIELICASRPNVNFGYKLPGGQIMVDIDKPLRSFEVAVGNGGIHAIGVITELANSSQWLGRLDETCIAHQLVSNGEVHALTGAYAVSFISFHCFQVCDFTHLQTANYS